MSATPGRTPADDGDRLTALTHHLGLSADHVRGFELVGLLGDPVAIDALRDPGLFGELRGANGSGVITALTIDLFPAGPLYAGGLLFSSAVGPEMLQRWRQWSAALPDTCSTSASWLRLPDRPQVPTTLRGQTVLHIRFAHVGDPVDGARLVAPMRPGALLDSIGEQPWSVVVGAEPGHRYAPLPALDQNFPPTRSVGNRLVAGCVV